MAETAGLNRRRPLCYSAAVIYPSSVTDPPLPVQPQTQALIRWATAQSPVGSLLALRPKLLGLHGGQKAVRTMQFIRQVVAAHHLTTPSFPQGRIPPLPNGNAWGKPHGPHPKHSQSLRHRNAPLVSAIGIGRLWREPAIPLDSRRRSLSCSQPSNSCCSGLRLSRYKEAMVDLPVAEI